MGLDAKMLVATTATLDEAGLRRLSYETGCAFGPRHFFIDRTGEFYGSPRHILSFDLEGYENRLDIDAVPPADGETLFRVRLGGRYYGEGYERGDLMVILDLRRWFMAKLPGCRVFYGTDHGEGLEELTDQREFELWDHFVAHQHRPYVSSFGLDGMRMPVCELCDETMDQYGFGGTYAAARCEGCGYDIETRDGGATWVERKARSRP